MEIKQKTYLEATKGDHLIQVIVDKDIPLGVLFDALMEFKGFAVQRMAESHNAEVEEAKKKMEEDEAEATKEESES